MVNDSGEFSSLTLTSRCRNMRKKKKDLEKKIHKEGKGERREKTLALLRFIYSLVREGKKTRGEGGCPARGGERKGRKKKKKDHSE